MLFKLFVSIGSVAGSDLLSTYKDFYSDQSVQEPIDYNAILGYGDSVYGSIESGYGSESSNLRKSVPLKPSTGKLVRDDYDITGELGSGSFGIVYKATSKAGGWEVALKMETRPPLTMCLTDYAPKGLMSLEYEYGMMKLMQGVPGFPQLYGGSFDSEPKHYAMELLGKSLESYRLAQPGQVVARTDLVRLAHQMVDRLQAMHYRGIVMHDIHPLNFLIHNDVVYVIDLGIAHKINAHCAMQTFCTQAIFGTGSRSSYATDDMRKLMYVLVFLAEGSLPWMRVPDHEKAIVNLFSTARDVCVGRAKWLLPAYEYIGSLTPGSVVDYAHLKQLIA